MKKNIFLAAMLIISAAVNAGPITRSQAEKNLKTFLGGKQILRCSASPVQSVNPTNEIEPYYIFNIGNNEGFVILSGDDATKPILGYSDKGHIDPDKMPENMKAWMNGYAQQLRAIQKMNLPARKETATRAAGWAKIDPLITCKWYQLGPYNLKCPEVEGIPLDSVATGCVATSMAQIMYYHKWPVKPTAPIPGYSYTFDTNKGKGHTVSMNIEALPPITFDWNSMTDTYDASSSEQSKIAVAQLMRYAGQGALMEYDDVNSGAKEKDAVNAFREYFDYDKGVEHLIRKGFENDNPGEGAWAKKIYDELAAKRPVMYHAAAKGSGGHSFVCDGYDGNDMFHINWGWNGDCNGFFSLDLLNPVRKGDPYNFDGDHAIVIGIKPNKPDIDVPDVNVVKTGDVNNDKIIDVFDVTCIVSIILENSKIQLYRDAADVNKDGSINASDITKLVNVILGKDVINSAAYSASNEMAAAGINILPFSINNGGEKEINVVMNNQGNDISAFQFDLRLPEGMTIKTKAQGVYDISLGSRTDKASHSVACSRLKDGTYRIIAYSMFNNTFAGNNGDVLSITLCADENISAAANEISMKNIIMSTPSANTIADEDKSMIIAISGDVTGINGITNDAVSFPADIYTIEGSLVKKNAYNLDGLAKGVYVINNKKIVK